MICRFQSNSFSWLVLHLTIVSLDLSNSCAWKKSGPMANGSRVSWAFLGMKDTQLKLSLPCYLDGDKCHYSEPSYCSSSFLHPFPGRFSIWTTLWCGWIKTPQVFSDLKILCGSCRWVFVTFHRLKRFEHHMRGPTRPIKLHDLRRVEHNI